MFSTIFGFVADYFVGIFHGLIGKAAVSLATATAQFITTDVGKLAFDAVAYVATVPQQSEVAARDAAKAKFIADAKAAGHDLAALGESQLNLFIELAYSAYKAKQA